MRAFIAAVLLAFSGAAMAQADEIANPDPAVEARLKNLGEELRCLVCQNQTNADSHAGLAVDLKNHVREQLKAGKSDREIIDFMVQRYGDFVLYRPPMKATTILLWTGPFVLMAVGLGAAVLIVRRRRQAVAEPPHLTEEQRRQAARLLDEPEIRS